jgi:predicted MPP superfamily phosphohydrolase
VPTDSAHRGLMLGGAVLGLGLGGLSWALVEARMFTLRHVQVPVLPRGNRSVSLLHLSDLHLVPSQVRKRDWVSALADLNPDVVIDTGDNLAHPQAVPAVLDAFGALLDRPGAFVMGSNDYFGPKPKNPARYLLRDPRAKGIADTNPLPTAELTAGFTRAGWKDLSNRRDVLTVAGVRFELVGVDDPHLNRDRFPAARTNAPKATPDEKAPVGAGPHPLGTEGTPDPEPVVRLGVTHAPYRRVLDQMHLDGCDLILAGHTHGGQLCVPGYGALVTNCDLDRGRAKGLHGWPGLRPDQPGGGASTWLHVSAGLGTSPYTPVRFACRPEATLVELVAR